MVPSRSRWFALGGIVGPAGFVAAWVVAGCAAVHTYSPIDDAISRLAAVGSGTRALMTVGFVAFGVGVPLFGLALRRAVPGPAWVAAVVTGLATLAVAATPLDRSALVDDLHAVAATVGYLSLVALPLLASRSFARSTVVGSAAWAAWSVAAGLVSAACLLLTVVDPASGLAQRAGLTVGDLWIAATATAILSGHLPARAAAD